MNVCVFDLLAKLTPIQWKINHQPVFNQLRECNLRQVWQHGVGLYFYRLLYLSHVAEVNSSAVSAPTSTLAGS